MKRRLELFLIILLPILGLILFEGKIMTLTKRPEQKVTTTSSKKVVQKSKEEIKKEQVAYLKEHEQEIVDFVKSKSSKVESVQIYWDETQWIDGGNGTPQGGDEVIEIFGTVNQLEDSGWRVDVVFDSDQKMTFGMGYNISIKGDYLE